MRHFFSALGVSLTLISRALAVSPTAAPYAPWAHSHFVWLDSTKSNQANVSNLVAGYQKHNITVGAIDIDSGWSTGYNNFVVDTAKFPDLVRNVDVPTRI